MNGLLVLTGAHSELSVIGAFLGTRLITRREVLLQIYGSWAWMLGVGPWTWELDIFSLTNGVRRCSPKGYRTTVLMEIYLMSDTKNTSIIVLDKFIQATRDSGYKGTYSAVAELVDNSLQAGARSIKIRIFTDTNIAEHPIKVAVLDDGCGIDSKTLRQALRFGGSTRFGKRDGLGRYGMGLPNSSLSQARRVDVYSWDQVKGIRHSYLDVGQISKGDLSEVPVPRRRAYPLNGDMVPSKTGTLVIWSECDRLSNKRLSTLEKKLSQSLGRIFRYFIWDGVEILINGREVKALDPLFKNIENGEPESSIFGEPLCYEIMVPGGSGSDSSVGLVEVTFTELPVHLWQSLSNEEKRNRGISNGAGVSIVRAKREIDFGWFFMGRKRRENYDDWWRCEIRFDPILDDAFGITHTKQQIRPQEFLSEILAPDLENMAKALNMRARKAHLQVKTSKQVLESEQTAMKCETLLSPLPKKANNAASKAIIKELTKQDRSLKDDLRPASSGSMVYRIVQANAAETTFYTYAVIGEQFVLSINPTHPFFKKVYESISEKEDTNSRELRKQIDLMLLASARAEAMATTNSELSALRKFRQNWSDILAIFLKR